MDYAPNHFQPIGDLSAVTDPAWHKQWTITYGGQLGKVAGKGHIHTSKGYVGLGWENLTQALVDQVEAERAKLLLEGAQPSRTDALAHEIGR